MYKWGTSLFMTLTMYPIIYSCYILGESIIEENNINGEFSLLTDIFNRKATKIIGQIEIF